jgi:hypothetical protein
MPYDLRMTSTGEPAGSSRGPALRLAVGVCSVLLLLSTTACSKAGGSAMAARVGLSPSPVSPARAISSSGPASVPPRTSPSADGTSTAPTTAGTAGVPLVVGRRVTAVRAGLSFEVPPGWQAFDPSRALRAGGAALPDQAKDLAARSGLSVDEYLQRVGTAMEVMVMGPRGTADNISVIPTPVPQLPTPDELRVQLESVGANVVRVDRVTTPLGPAIVADSRLPMGSFATHTRSVAVEHAGHVSFLTVTATTGAAADSLLREMLASLRPA